MPDVGPVENGGYGLSSRKTKQWSELEDSLISLGFLLDKFFYTRIRPALDPVPASFVGFNKTFNSARAACVGIAASRDWFLMWMALLSSKMADVESFQIDWFGLLVGRAQFCSQDWLSAVQSSMLCDFSWRCPRVGTFLNVEDPDPNQPSVEWFFSWNIPVWYCPSRVNTKFKNLQPPPHILQLSTTFLSKSPSHSRAPFPSRASSPPPPTEYSGREHEKAQNAYIATKPWEAYFTAHKLKNQERISKETPTQCLTRINREKKKTNNIHRGISLGVVCRWIYRACSHARYQKAA